MTEEVKIRFRITLYTRAHIAAYTKPDMLKTIKPIYTQNYDIIIQQGPENTANCYNSDFFFFFFFFYRRILISSA